MNLDLIHGKIATQAEVDEVKANFKPLTTSNVSYAPKGGTTGQILQKKSNTDGDTQWVDGKEYHEYSTSEKAVGKDENGNTVYTITLKGNVPTTDGQAIYSLSGKTLLEYNGRVQYYNNGITGFVPFGWHYGDDNMINLVTEGTSLKLYYAGEQYKSQPYRVTIQYTKSV